MNEVYLGLGSNKGERLTYLKRAIDELHKVGKVITISPVYETEPWGKIGQPPFLNAVIRMETELAPLLLLREIKVIEQRIGRQPSQRWGPREIDIDILFYDELVLDTHELKVPHPYLHVRPFVLIPLADIAPDLVHPVLKKTVYELVKELSDDDRDKVRRYAATIA